MSSERSYDTPPTSSPAPAAAASGPGKWAVTAIACVALVGVGSSAMLWQKLSVIQEHLAMQSANSGAQAIEARTMAREAQELSRDAAARVTLAETRLAEVTLQRSQLEELMQNMSRSRDDNLVADIDASIRLAQQQSQLTASLQPLVLTLKNAQARIERAEQPRLAPLQRAIAHDLDALNRTNVTDTAGLLTRIDDLAVQIDSLPLKNEVGAASAARLLAKPPVSSKSGPADADVPWWKAALQTSWEVVRDEARGLVRVSRIDQPEAMLIAPEQAFFLRENLKLKLLNARLGILSRQFDSARADLSAAQNSINTYFDPQSRRTQAAANTLQLAQSTMKEVQQPRLDDTLTALATAAAGR